jgi:biotin/methionine sulfoxide reductase
VTKWISIRPNTDTAMLLALVHTLVSNRLHDEAFLASYCVGFERVRPYVMGETDGQPKDAAWASTISGVRPTPSAPWLAAWRLREQC